MPTDQRTQGNKSESNNIEEPTEATSTKKLNQRQLVLPRGLLRVQPGVRQRARPHAGGSGRRAHDLVAVVSPRGANELGGTAVEIERRGGRRGERQRHRKEGVGEEIDEGGDPPRVFLMDDDVPGTACSPARHSTAGSGGPDHT